MERYRAIGAWSRCHHSLYADSDTLVSVRAFDPSQSRSSQAKGPSPLRIILPNRSGEAEVKTGCHRSSNKHNKKRVSFVIRNRNKNKNKLPKWNPLILSNSVLFSYYLLLLLLLLLSLCLLVDWCIGSWSNQRFIPIDLGIFFSSA